MEFLNTVDGVFELPLLRNAQKCHMPWQKRKLIQNKSHPRIPHLVARHEIGFLVSRKPFSSISMPSHPPEPVRHLFYYISLCPWLLHHPRGIIVLFDKKSKTRFVLVFLVYRFWTFLGEGSSKTPFKHIIFWPLNHPRTKGPPAHSDTIPESR
jgi:hypothetical protein